MVAAESGGESGTVEAASSRDARTRVISGPFSDQAPRFCIRPPPTLATDSSLASYFQGCLENRRSSQCVQAACRRRPWGGERIRGAIKKGGKEQRFVQGRAGYIFNRLADSLRDIAMVDVQSPSPSSSTRQHPQRKKASTARLPPVPRFAVKPT